MKSIEPASADRLPPADIEKLINKKMGVMTPEMQGRLDFFTQAHQMTQANDLVLDVGSGTSWYAPIFQHTRYLATDRKMYSQKLQKEGNPRLFFESEANALPLADNVIDVALSVSMLEHLPEPFDYLKEVHRVLKPGGRLCLFVPYSTGIHMEPWDFYRYTEHGLRYLFEKAGFVAIDVQPSCGVFATLLGNTKKFIPYTQKKGWLIRKLSSAFIWRFCMPLAKRIDHWDTKRKFPRFYLAFAQKAS